MKPKAVKLKMSTWMIVSQAVETGVAFGVRRAFKYNETPSEKELKIHVENEVMNALSDIIIW